MAALRPKWLDRMMRSNGIKMGRTRHAVMAREDDTGLLQAPGSLIDQVGHALSMGRMKRYVSLGGDLLEAASPFLDKPTWWSGVKALLQMGKVLVDDVEVWADDYFATDEWDEPYSADFNQTLLPLLQRFPYERLKTNEENTHIRICTLPNGVRCGWTAAGRLQQVDHIYVESARLDEARACIKQLLWAQFQGKSLIMRKNVSAGSRDARVVFEVDNAFESKTSARAVSYAEYLRRPIDQGVPRSVMFYGPPGTGKSTMARTIVELMNMRSFRIRIGDVDNLDNATLFEALSIFEPDAVILDDFDRAHAQAQLLETMEQFQRTVKLVIVTVNDRRRLDDALMRPERIDELYLIDRMDEEVVRHVLGPYVDGYESVKDWPIAFIGEYVKRRRFMRPDEAEASLKELTRRVAELSENHERGPIGNIDVRSMIDLLKKADHAERDRCPEGADDAPSDDDEE